jgi:lysophospholipase L1-like esterase
VPKKSVVTTSEDVVGAAGHRTRREQPGCLRDRIVTHRSVRRLGAPLSALALVAVLLGVTGQAASARLADALGRTPRIMALGDSITVGCCVPPVGYWQFLSEDLVAGGYEFILVGSVHNFGNFGIEGHAGAWPRDLVYGIPDPSTGQRNGGIGTWMPQSTPDVVLVHAGTNGIMPSTLSYDPATAQWGSQVADMKTLLDGIFAANPNAYVVLAQIISLRTPSSGTTEYNRQLGLMASVYGNDHLSLIDMEDILAADPQGNYVDGTHPGPPGLKIMADAWYRALVPVLDGSQTNPTVPLPPSSLLVVRLAMRNSRHQSSIDAG